MRVIQMRHTIYQHESEAMVDSAAPPESTTAPTEAAHFEAAPFE